MAWIKMRTELDTDPAVIFIASKLDLPETQVVGMLHRVWSWADAQSRNGHAPGVTQSWLDGHAGVAGFASAMVEVGWLEVHDDRIVIPNFDRHMSQSAKQRALASKRKQVERSRSCHATSVTETRPDKRREDKKSSPPTPPRGAEEEAVFSRLRHFGIGVGPAAGLVEAGITVDQVNLAARRAIDQESAGNVRSRAGLICALLGDELAMDETRSKPSGGRRPRLRLSKETSDD